MSDTPQRIAAKFFLEEPDAFELGELIPVFHGWIQRGGEVDGLVIDVADYSHVPQGPGVMLIGHEWDRYLDLGLPGPGVMSTAKRDIEGDFVTRVQTVVADALHVASRLADDPSLGDRAAIRMDEVEITIFDRLWAPNTPETLARLEGELGSALAPANGGRIPALEQVGDARRPFRVRAGLSGSTDVVETRDALRRVATTA